LDIENWSDKGTLARTLITAMEENMAKTAKGFPWTYLIRHARMQHVAFECETFDELLGTYARLKGLGILPLWATDHGLGHERAIVGEFVPTKP
jgi:hypothetical protein